MTNKTYYIIILSLALFYGCSSTARFTSARQAKSIIPIDTNEANIDEIVKDIQPDEVMLPLETEIGIASYYADEFNGRPTASGVIYDMNKVSAAHPFHPLGTIARITNLINNKSVVLEINDRMPYRPDRIIDLSLGAARELDMLIVGIQKVKIEVLQWGTGKELKELGILSDLDCI